MKKQIILVLVFILLLIAIPMTVYLVKQRQELREKAVPATALYITPTTSTVGVGDTFSVNVQIDTGSNQVGAAKIYISVDPSYLELLTFEAGSDLPAILLSPSVDASSGIASITVGAQNINQLFQGQGTAAVLTMRALAVAQTTISINGPNDTPASSVSSSKNEADWGVNVLVATSNGNVDISSGGGPSPTPGTSPSPNASPTPGGPSPSPGSASPSPSPTATSQVTRIITPADGSTVTTARPVISGESFDDALIVLSISNTSINNTLYADASGDWSYTPTTDLANGTYTVTVTAEDDQTGATETATSTFTVSVGGTGGTTLTPTPTPSLTATTDGDDELPVTSYSTPTLFLLTLAMAMFVFGIFVLIG